MKLVTKSTLQAFKMRFLVQNITINPGQFNLLILVLAMCSAPNESKIADGTTHVSPYRLLFCLGFWFIHETGGQDVK